MRRISKGITKHYQMAGSSMSYTPFAFYRLMFIMCLLFLYLRLFCYIIVTRQNHRQSPTKTYLFILIRTKQSVTYRMRKWAFEAVSILFLLHINSKNAKRCQIQELKSKEGAQSAERCLSSRRLIASTAARNAAMQLMHVRRELKPEKRNWL